MKNYLLLVFPLLIAISTYSNGTIKEAKLLYEEGKYLESYAILNPLKSNKKFRKRGDFWALLSDINFNFAKNGKIDSVLSKLRLSVHQFEAAKQAKRNRIPFNAVQAGFQARSQFAFTKATRLGIETEGKKALSFLMLSNTCNAYLNLSIQQQLNYLENLLEIWGQSIDYSSFTDKDLSYYFEHGNAVLGRIRLDTSVRIDLRIYAFRLNLLGGKYAEAEKLGKQLTKDSKYVEYALGKLAELKMNEAKFEMALEYLHQAYAMNPYNSDVKFYIAYASELLGRISDAKLHYEELLLTHPNYHEANFNLGVIYFNEGLEDLKKIVELKKGEDPHWEVVESNAYQKLNKSKSLFQAYLLAKIEDQTTEIYLERIALLMK